MCYVHATPWVISHLQDINDLKFKKKKKRLVNSEE